MRKICIAATAALTGLLAQSPAWSATYHMNQSTIHGVVFHNCYFNGGPVIHGIIIMHHPIGIPPATKQN